MAHSVLIVDDAAFMRMMIKDILVKNGYNVIGEAENGQVAVDKYQELKPDLVTLDITMPEKDGIQALKEIKEIDANATVIMCSAMGQQAMVIRSEEHTSELQSRGHLVCRLLLEKKNKNKSAQIYERLDE